MSSLRRKREERGLSQTELAVAAGVSRQLIGAVEGGRHVPGVNSALALAAALDTSVEELFGTSRRESVPVLGRPPRDGAPVMTARVGELLCYAPLPDGGADLDRWARRDGTFRAGRVELFPGADPSGLAVAGCDPALGLAAGLLPDSGPRRLVPIAASSGAAVAALDGGRLHGAVVHGIEGRLRRNETDVRAVELARWEVGLASRPGSAAALADIATGRLPVARRDPGAEAQGALERALDGFDRRELRGPVASGHLDAARRVALGAVEAAVTMCAAALAYKLDFLPLEQHVVELRIAEAWSEHPGARALNDVMVSSAFTTRVAALGGYELGGTGTSIA